MNKLILTTFVFLAFIAATISGCENSPVSPTFTSVPSSTVIPLSSPTNTPAVTVAAAQTPTATSTPVAMCPGAPAISIRRNVWAQVSLYPPLYSNVRSEPGLKGERIAKLKPGQAVWIADGPRCADGYTWWFVRSLDKLEGWTAEGDSVNYWIYQFYDTFFYDTNDQSTKSNVVLNQGQKYWITMSGTYSLWVPEQWTDNGVCIRGESESTPMFPSPGKTNGPVGADPYYRFARPFYGPCQNALEPGETISAMMFSTDGGNNYSIPVPMIAQYRKDHAYIYEVNGQGHPLNIKLDDPVLNDNYGRIFILIKEAD